MAEHVDKEETEIAVAALDRTLAVVFVVWGVLV